MMKPLIPVIAVLLTFGGVLLADRSESGTPRVMQGPMLGAVAPNSQRVWARLSGDFNAEIVYWEDRPEADRQRAVLKPAGRPGDFTRIADLKGLNPSTRYHYIVEIEERGDRYLGKRPPFRFQTPESVSGRFRVGFGSCARFAQDRVQPIWKAVQVARPDFFIWLGDNIYGDSLLPSILAEEYQRQRDVASLQPVLHSIPQLATWDDHDFGLNDHDRTNPVADAARELFQGFWANPPYANAEDSVYFQYHYRGIDFFFLDNRSFRDPYFMEDGPGKTQLGEMQLDWLKTALKASTSPFKFLVCGGGWTSLKGPEGDSWAAFLHERNALFDWIMEEGIEGVVLMSGDTHRAEVNRIHWSERGGYDLTEFVSSPLAQEPSRHLRTMPEGLQPKESALITPYIRSPNFGLLTVDPDPDNGQVHFTLINDQGQKTGPPVVLKIQDLRINEKNELPL